MAFSAQNQSEAVRPTHYAGSWYDNNPASLKKELDKYMSQALTAPDQPSHLRVKADPSEPISGPVMAIIVPHAGFMFSGQTAAHAYKSAQRKNIKRVFLLGPSHHIGFPGAGLPAAKSFATPLGDLQVDTDMVTELQSYPFFSVQPNVHAVEHSLELQLPFIKHCFGDVKIVPIVIGQINDESEARIIGEILKGYVNKDDLVVVSCDFTHYGPRYQYTPFVYLLDIPERIGQLDGQAFGHLKTCDLDGFAGFLKHTECTICGMFPCEVLMAMLPQQAHGTLLKYATSSEVSTDDKPNSVSYLAIAYSGAEWPATPGAVRPANEVINLNGLEKMALLQLATETVVACVQRKKQQSAEELGITITDAMKQCFGVFVTINKKAPKGQQKELRGCIGSIYPSKQLYKAVQENAISSCSRDHRFMPVHVAELPEIEIELSILTPPRRVASFNEIVVGRDGVILAKAGRQAVFLPNVATEWNWNLEEMLSQLSLKAGLGPDDWRDGAKFDVFQAEKVG